MKPFHLVFAALFVSSIVLCGCTTSSSVPLGERSDALSIDEGLFGTWRADSKDADVKEITIRPSSAKNIYIITVNDKGEFYESGTDIFDAWIIDLKDKQYMVLQEVYGARVKEAYLAFQISSHGDSFTSHDIKLPPKDEVDIKSTKDFQKKVIASMNKAGFIAATTKWSKKK